MSSIPHDHAADHAADHGHAPDELSDLWTPLIWAARRGALDAIAALLDAGAGIDDRDRLTTRWTPLQHAIHRRQAGATRLLLERGRALGILSRAGICLGKAAVAFGVLHSKGPLRRFGGEFGLLLADGGLLQRVLRA